MALVGSYSHSQQPQRRSHSRLLIADIATGTNASHSVSGGAYGSERSACWAKSGNGHYTTPVNYNKPGYIDIKLSTLSNLSSLSNSNPQAVLASAAYPPSPPAVAEALTLANVATLPSSYSTISTTPTSDQSDSESESSSSEISFSASSEAASVDSSDLFLRIVFGSTYMADFARHGLKVSGTDVVETTGAVVESHEHGTKTLYCAPSPSKLDREALVDLMELADEQLDCDGLVICLDKSSPELEGTLHSLLYVGGCIVPPDAGMLKFAEHVVLVGLDL